jgi:hypothetical protein
MKTIHDLPGHARVWIYQANRFLNESESKQIDEAIQAFIDRWSSHGQQMDASAAIMNDRLVVIAADEAQAAASGCGIDKSVQWMKELGSLMGIDFFQRTQVLFYENEELKEAPLHQFWAMRKAGLVGDDTLIFDNTVKNLAELRSSWKVPFSRSWHSEMWQR